MASIIKASIDLNKIPKDKIFVGKKGKYFLLQLLSMMNWINSVIKDQ
jgi:hypothetical protein